MKRTRRQQRILREMNDSQIRFKFLINRSNNLYAKYLEEPLYINAMLLKHVNKKIIDVLTREGVKLGDERSVNLVLDHFLIWYIQFQELEKQNFKLLDEFKFERIKQSIPYPKDLITRILNSNNK